MSTDRRQIVTEELWRSVVWLAIGLFGWSLIITSSEMIEASAFTALGLPILTAALLFGIMVGIRLLTGLELKANTEGSQLLWLITGSVLGGFLVLYDVAGTPGDTPEGVHFDLHGRVIEFDREGNVTGSN